MFLCACLCIGEDQFISFLFLSVSECMFFMGNFVFFSCYNLLFFLVLLSVQLFFFFFLGFSGYGNACHFFLLSLCY